MHQFTVDKLNVYVGDTPIEMAQHAAASVGVAYALYAGQEWVNMMFAGAESQRDFQRTLAHQPDIEWARVHAYNIDDYWDPAMDPALSVGACLDAYLYNVAQPAALDRVNPLAPDTQAERARYEAVLAKVKLDIACIGVGESGHIGLNEAGQTRFDDDALVRMVELPPASIAQLERDEFLGGAPIPTKGITTTMPKLMEADHLYVIVPYSNKADIVARLLSEPISEALPATILRTHPNAHLYLDAESASLIGKE
jgi:glucosamine-6-phosphate deaminase